MSTFVILAFLMATPPTSKPDFDNEIQIPINLLTDEEARKRGKDRAKADYAAGTPAIERFGLFMTPFGVDPETGLYFRNRGCAIMQPKGIEADAYNARIRELIAKHGLPINFQDIRKRFELVQSFFENPPQLSWFSLDLLETEAEQSICFGTAEVIRRHWKKSRAVPIHPSSVLIRSEPREVECLITRCPGRIRVAVWDEIEVVVIQEETDAAKTRFFDIRNMQIMWESSQELYNLINQIRTRVDSMSTSN